MTMIKIILVNLLQVYVTSHSFITFSPFLGNNRGNISGNLFHSAFLPFPLSVVQS